MKKIGKYFLIISMIGMVVSCKKFLDEKPRQSLNVPSNFEDLQSLLDNAIVMNRGGYGNSLIEVVADDYYVTFNDWQNRSYFDRQEYIWGDVINTAHSSWNSPYTDAIYSSNVVLDAINQIKENDNLILKNNILGSALFFRAIAFFKVAQLYCKPYSSTASKDLGIVLRVTSALEAKSVRSTVAETYQKILLDLTNASDLLPEKSDYVTRPTKTAAFSMLARVYLSMRDYDNALKYSNISLSLNDNLIDYNDLNTSNPASIFPWYTSNPEVIFFSTLVGSNLTQPSRAKIDSNLYRSYSNSDLRKTVFFLQNTGANVGTYAFNGSYYFRANIFNGLSTAEQYLIKAECLARKGSISESMMTLNTLLSKRYRRNIFTGLIASNAVEAKQIILAERRKELLFRGLRWSDLRRLNLEGENITLKRVLNGVSYNLPPNDARWVMPIPTDEIDRSGIPQNPR